MVTWSHKDIWHQRSKLQRCLQPLNTHTHTHTHSGVKHSRKDIYFNRLLEAENEPDHVFSYTTEVWNGTPKTAFIQERVLY